MYNKPGFIPIVIAVVIAAVIVGGTTYEITSSKKNIVIKNQNAEIEKLTQEIKSLKNQLNSDFTPTKPSTDATGKEISSDFTPTKPSTDATGKEISFEKVDKCMTLGSYRNSGRFVINNQQEWENLSDKTESNSSGMTAKCPLPDIDFSEKTVIAVFQGEKSSGGYDIEITKVVENQNSIDVLIKETSPGLNCMTAAVMTTPSHIVAIPKTSKKINFSVSKEIDKCQ